jgi:Zn-dependent protease
MTETPEAPPAPPPPPKPPNNWVGLGLLATWLALGAGLLFSPALTGPLTFGFVMVGWILAVMAHEFSHAAVAHMAGDSTVAEKGYLSFDPRRYGDLGTSLVIPLLALALGGIGFPGGAVYLRNDLMRSPAWRAAASLAGPAATFLVLLLLAAVLYVWAHFGATGPLFAALTVLAFLQATALILNLLPIPGLDGFNAIRPFLPASVTAGLHRAEALSMLALLLVLFWVPGAGALLFGTAAALGERLGLIPEALQFGWRAFRFWS